MAQCLFRFGDLLFPPLSPSFPWLPFPILTIPIHSFYSPSITHFYRVFLTNGGSLWSGWEKMGLYLFATPSIVFFFYVRCFLTGLCRRCAFFFVPCYFYRQTSINKTALVLSSLYARAASFFLLSCSHSPCCSPPPPLPICFSDYDVDDSNVPFFSSLDLTTVSQLSVIILSNVICFIGGGVWGRDSREMCAIIFQKSIIKDRKRKKKYKELHSISRFESKRRGGGGGRRREEKRRERRWFCLLSCSRFLLPVLLASVIWGIWIDSSFSFLSFFFFLEGLGVWIVRCEGVWLFEWVGKSFRVKSEEDVVLTLKDFVVDKRLYLIICYCSTMDLMICIVSQRIRLYHIVHIL